MANTIQCVDLFAGCGGLSLGLQQAGIHIAAAFESWNPAIDTYRKNFSHPIFEQDLSKVADSVDKIKEFSPDMIVGGPPCQDFSSAGKRDVNGGRADLTYSFAEIVTSILPSWFVMENVEPIKKSHILKDVVDQYIQHGYGLTAAILDASYCNVPQARTRFFLIGHLGDSHNQLIPYLTDNLNDEQMTMRDYFGDSLQLQYYYRHPRNYNRRGIFTLDEPSPTVRGVNRPIPSGYKINTCDPIGADLREIRPLTTIERSYVQTFPKDFILEGSKTNLEQLIGNAVPVKLAEFIGRCILDYIDLGPKESITEMAFEMPFEIPQKKLKPLGR